MAIITIAYSCIVENNQVVIRNSQGDSITSNSPKVLLDFLAKNYGDGALNRKMFWNLDIAIAPILKRLGLGICKELVKEPNCEALWEFTDDGINLHDLKGKPKDLPEGVYSLYYHRQTSCGLQIHGQRKSYFYNLCQFYEDSESEITIPKDILTKANELVNAFFAMGLNPLKMSSPISVYQSNVLDHIDFPTVADIPTSLPEMDCDELVNMAEEICHREWTTCYAIGRWLGGDTFDYDLQSAYGWAFSELYNYKYATFIKSKTPIKDATWGVLKGTITINEGVKCSPICYKKQNGQMINPIGCSWYDKITLPEVRWIYRRGIGKFKLDEGIFWKQNAPVRPFKVHMERIFNQRLQDGLVKKLAKRIGASSWSKCIQRTTNDGEISKFYNPIFALQVKTSCRLRVADFIYDHNLQGSILHIGTDGARVTRQVSIPEKVELGAWKESPQDSCIIISPGRIYTPTHKPSGLYYDDIVRLINESPNESYYATKLTRRLTLGEAIEMDNLDKVGELAKFETSIDLIAARLEQDMEFKDFPNTGKQLLEHRYYGTPYTL